MRFSGSPVSGGMIAYSKELLPRISLISQIIKEKFAQIRGYGFVFPLKAIEPFFHDAGQFYKNENPARQIYV